MLLICTACPPHGPSSATLALGSGFVQQETFVPPVNHSIAGLLHNHRAATMEQCRSSTRADPAAAIVTGHGNFGTDKSSNMPLLFVIQQMLLICTACPPHGPSSATLALGSGFVQQETFVPPVNHSIAGLLHNHHAATMEQCRSSTRADPAAAIVTGHGNFGTDKSSNMPLLFVIQQAMLFVSHQYSSSEVPHGPNKADAAKHHARSEEYSTSYVTGSNHAMLFVSHQYSSSEVPHGPNKADAAKHHARSEEYSTSYVTGSNHVRGNRPVITYRSNNVSSASAVPTITACYVCYSARLSC
ncbi:uncharacterized protein ISCGN_007741 [Ixodes scapularis]